MRYIITGFVLLILVAACRPKPQVPKGVLEREKMQAVLWDMIQADEFLRDFVLNRDSTLNDTLESIRMYERVFRFHQTTRKEFDSSFTFYRRRPALMKEIFDSLYNKTLKLSPTDAPTAPVDNHGQHLQVPGKPHIDTSKAFPRVRKALESQ